MEVETIKTDNGIATSGLAIFIGKEILAPAGTHADKDYVLVLRYIIDYVVNSRPEIKHGQSIGYFSWILQFLCEEDPYFSLYEANEIGSGYIRGVDTAIRVVNGQIRECQAANAQVIFPLFNQMVVVSDGVYDEIPLQAVRYPSPPHMTGWWITTDLYNGDVKSLKTEHYYHIAFKRPDLLRFLALPFGYRFLVGPDQEVEVYFDEEATH